MLIIIRQTRFVRLAASRHLEAGGCFVPAEPYISIWNVIGEPRGSAPVPSSFTPVSHLIQACSVGKVVFTSSP